MGKIRRAKEIAKSGKVSYDNVRLLRQIHETEGGHMMQLEPGEQLVDLQFAGLRLIQNEKVLKF